MKREDKKALIADMAERLKKAQATFLVDYQGLNVEMMNALRRDLRKSEAEFHVVKNRLLKMASEGSGASAIKEHFVGPCALAISYGDVVAPAKVLVEQEKKLERLKVKIGQIGGKAIDHDGIKRLAELPGREVLLALALSAMQAVPGSLVRVLQAVISNFLNVLKAVENKKSEA